MPKATLYNMAGEVKGEVQLSDAVFGIEPNEAVLHAAVKCTLANRRQGTQSALTKAEVSGGGIKPLRQKGSGHARQGSTRNPHFTHGGVAFAPKPRDYSYSLNKKVTRLAIKSALSQKVLDKAIIVVDELALAEIKTKSFQNFLDAVKVDGKAIVVTEGVKENIVKSARNLPGIVTTISTILSTYDILNADTLIVEKAALEKIEEVYA